MSVTDDRLEHRLAVVLFSDLVGWSTLTAEDHDRAIALVRRFQAAVRAAVPAERGRIVKFVGDAALVESPSAESAVAAAAELRQSMADDGPIRTGIHLGEVSVAADGDLYGDGVNVAQRIQSVAEPGEVLVSEDVRRLLRNRPAYAFEAVGERELKGLEAMELHRLLAVDGARIGARPDRGAEPAAAPRGERRPASDRSIAVLPFANLSPHAENEYFSDGVTEAILMMLTKLGGLKVISRTSVMRYKDTQKSVRQIGDELGVATVLEGSVQRAGNRVRITAQLIETSTDHHLWADTYDRDLDDLFAIQTDVAERIVGSLDTALTPVEKARLASRPTESLEAYEWFLKGRHFLARRTDEDLERAIAHFRKAVEADPTSALAWSGLADACALSHHYSAVPVAEMLDQARRAAERGIGLDPGLGEAHVSLAFVANTEWAWDEAAEAYRRGLELSPGYATAHHWYGTYLMSQDRIDEAVASLQRARELDPLSMPVRSGLMAAYYFARRYGRANEIGREALELDRDFVPIHVNFAEMSETRERYAEALAEWEEVHRLAPDWVPADLLAAIRAGYETDGARGYWEGFYEGLHAHPDLHDSRFWTARSLARLDRIEDALTVLEDLVARHDAHAYQIRLDPVFDGLRSEPRYAALLARMGLA